MTSRVDVVCAEVAAVLTSLRGVWDEVVVDEWDHALQAAARAIEDGADEELVLAAALHDIGHSPLLGGPGIDDHSRVARDWLRPRFGERVAWLAGAHVAAKRYLAATAPGYAATLSDTSVWSLDAQGGAGVERSFTEHPWCADALRLRQFDDAAKDPAASAAPVDVVLELARRLAR